MKASNGRGIGGRVGRGGIGGRGIGGRGIGGRGRGRVGMSSESNHSDLPKHPFSPSGSKRDIQATVLPPFPPEEKPSETLNTLGQPTAKGKNNLVKQLFLEESNETSTESIKQDAAKKAFNDRGIGGRGGIGGIGGRGRVGMSSESNHSDLPKHPFSPSALGRRNYYRAVTPLPPEEKPSEILKTLMKPSDETKINHDVVKELFPNENNETSTESIKQKAAKKALELFFNSCLNPYEYRPLKREVETFYSLVQTLVPNPNLKIELEEQLKEIEKDIETIKNQKSQGNDNENIKKLQDEVMRQRELAIKHNDLRATIDQAMNKLLVKQNAVNRKERLHSLRGSASEIKAELEKLGNVDNNQSNRSVDDKDVLLYMSSLMLQVLFQADLKYLKNFNLGMQEKFLAESQKDSEYGKLGVELIEKFLTLPIARTISTQSEDPNKFISNAENLLAKEGILQAEYLKKKKAEANLNESRVKPGNLKEKPEEQSEKKKKAEANLNESRVKPGNLNEKPEEQSEIEDSSTLSDIVLGEGNETNLDLSDYVDQSKRNLYSIRINGNNVPVETNKDNNLDVNIDKIYEANEVIEPYPYLITEVDEVIDIGYSTIYKKNDSFQTVLGSKQGFTEIKQNDIDKDKFVESLVRKFCSYFKEHHGKNYLSSVHESFMQDRKSSKGVYLVMGKTLEYWKKNQGNSSNNIEEYSVTAIATEEFKKKFIGIKHYDEERFSRLLSNIAEEFNVLSRIFDRAQEGSTSNEWKLKKRIKDVEIQNKYLAEKLAKTSEILRSTSQDLTAASMRPTRDDLKTIEKKNYELEKEKNGLEQLLDVFKEENGKMLKRLSNIEAIEKENRNLKIKLAGSEKATEGNNNNNNGDVPLTKSNNPEQLQSNQEPGLKKEQLKEAITTKNVKIQTDPKPQGVSVGPNNNPQPQQQNHSQSGSGDIHPRMRWKLQHLIKVLGNLNVKEGDFPNDLGWESKVKEYARGMIEWLKEKNEEEKTSEHYKENKEALNNFTTGDFTRIQEAGGIGKALEITTTATKKVRIIDLDHAKFGKVPEKWVQGAIEALKLANKTNSQEPNSKKTNQTHGKG